MGNSFIKTQQSHNVIWTLIQRCQHARQQHCYNHLFSNYIKCPGKMLKSCIWEKMNVLPNCLLVAVSVWNNNNFINTNNYSWWRIKVDKFTWRYMMILMWKLKILPFQCESWGFLATLQFVCKSLVVDLCVLNPGNVSPIYTQISNPCLFLFVWCFH